MSVDNVKNKSSNELSDQELDGVVGGSSIGDALKKLKTGLQGGASDLKGGAEHMASDLQAIDLKGNVSDLKGSADHKISVPNDASASPGCDRYK